MLVEDDPPCILGYAKLKILKRIINFNLKGAVKKIKKKFTFTSSSKAVFR
jgi:hypothetical protein